MCLDMDYLIVLGVMRCLRVYMSVFVWAVAISKQVLAIIISKLEWIMIVFSMAEIKQQLIITFTIVN